MPISILLNTLSFVRQWLPQLSLWQDDIPHAAALNMAIDEALLAQISGPVLRVYRWIVPAVSFGYFEHWAPIRDAYPDRDPVRRWTGGGVVLHGEDFTYSLLIPRHVDIPPVTPIESYAIIHGALCGALEDAGIPAAPASAASPKMSHACFENAVMHDVLAGGRKIAGAAQRRTRAGLIHQGSVQSVELPEGFAGGFASKLAGRVSSEEFDVSATAGELATAKYGSRPWLERC